MGTIPLANFRPWLTWERTKEYIHFGRCLGITGCNILLNALREMTLLEDLAAMLRLLTEVDRCEDQVQCFTRDALAGDTTEIGPKLEPIHTILTCHWLVVICHSVEREMIFLSSKDRACGR